MSRLSPGDVFAGYTIERELGAGGMGEVYLARHPRLPRYDALKVLASHLSGDPKYRARFEREADVVAGLRHPSIVSVHDRGDSDGRLWIALEYVEGHDLTRHVAADTTRGEPLPPAEVARIITQIADALDAAARRGLTHRDVKPANILLEEDGRAQLTDFGIAYPGDGVTKLTGTGIALGTVAFAAPEQLQGHAVDARADQYSLACTAFALLTGTNLYSGASVAAIAVSHVRDPIPVATERAPGRVPPAVDAVFSRALAKNRDDRFPDSRSFAAALTAALDTRAPAPGRAGATILPPAPDSPAAPDSAAAPGSAAPGPGAATPPAGGTPPTRPPLGQTPLGGTATVRKPPGATTRKDPGAVQRLPNPPADPTTARFDRTGPTDNSAPPTTRDPAPPTTRFASPQQSRRPDPQRPDPRWQAHQGPTPPPSGPQGPGHRPPPHQAHQALRPPAQPPATPRPDQTPAATTRPTTQDGFSGTDGFSLSGDLATPWSGPAATQPATDGRRRSRKGLLIGAVVLAVVLVAGIVTWALSSGDDSSGTSATPNLKSARSEPLWTWKPKVLSDNYQEDIGIVGGTSEYAIAASKIDSGATVLSVLNAADGTTERTVTLSDKSLTITGCQPLGDDDSATVVCWASESGDPQPYVVDLGRGTVAKADAQGSDYAVTGNDYVLVDSDAVYSGSAKGKNFSLTGVTVRSSYPPVNGSPVINLTEGTATTLRGIATGETIVGFNENSTDQTWQPFRNGFVVRKPADNSSDPAQFTFYDSTGNITADLSGEWTLPTIPTGGVIPPSVPAVPILVNDDDRRIAAFDPSSGKKLWEENYQSASADSVQGIGETIVLRSSANEFEWFNVSDGSGGPIYVPPKSGQAGVPLGGDGTSFAMLSVPANGGAGSQELLVYGQGGSSPKWQLRVPSTDKTPGAPVIAGGKVYAGGALDFGDRRIL